MLRLVLKAQSIDWLTEKYFTIGSWDADYFPCGKVSPSSDSISLRGHNTSTTTNHMIYLDLVQIMFVYQVLEARYNDTDI